MVPEQEQELEDAKNCFNPHSRVGSDAERNANPPFRAGRETALPTDCAKPYLSQIGRDGDRTRNGVQHRRINNPVRIPIPPLGQFRRSRVEVTTRVLQRILFISSSFL